MCSSSWVPLQAEEIMAMFGMLAISNGIKWKTQGRIQTILTRLSLSFLERCDAN